MNVRVCDICGATIDESNTRYNLQKRAIVYESRKNRFNVINRYEFARIDNSKTTVLDICEDCIKMIEDERKKQNERIMVSSNNNLANGNSNMASNID